VVVVVVVPAALVLEVTLVEVPGLAAPLVVQPVTINVSPTKASDAERGTRRLVNRPRAVASCRPRRGHRRLTVPIVR
jgi:hypothetical protein